MPLNPISQSEFDVLLSQYNPHKELSEQLKSRGYSTILKDIKVNANSKMSIDFSNCHFEHSTLSGQLQNSNFQHTTFKDSIIENANLSNALFYDADFSKTSLKNSDLSQSVFMYNQFNNHMVYNCNFNNSTFIANHINKAVFSKAQFKGTFEYHNALTDMHLVFNQQYHNEDVFKNAKTHLIEPTVVVVDDSEWHDTPFYIIGQYGGKPVTVNQYNDLINDIQLQNEVQKVIADIKVNGLHAHSIAEQVINSDQLNIQAIKKYAYNIMEKADALWIPGGADLHPEFYGEQTTDAMPATSYYREVLEFSLAQAAIHMDKPIIGICHGSQLMNVYLGGTLHQHVDTPYGYVQLKTHTDQGILGSLLDKTLLGPSYHHQAVKDVAPTLEVVASYQGVIKATQPTDNKKIMLCQFHPEYEADHSSVNILNKFIDVSAEQKLNAKILSLSEVIDMTQTIQGLDSNHSTVTMPVPASSTVVNDFHYVTPQQFSPAELVVALFL